MYLFYCCIIILYKWGHRTYIGHAVVQPSPKLRVMNQNGLPTHFYCQMHNNAIIWAFIFLIKIEGKFKKIFFCCAGLFSSDAVCGALSLSLSLHILKTWSWLLAEVESDFCDSLTVNCMQWYQYENTRKRLLTLASPKPFEMERRDLSVFYVGRCSVMKA